MAARPNVYVKKQVDKITIEVRVFAPSNMCHDCIADVWDDAADEADNKLSEKWPTSLNEGIRCLEEGGQR